MLLISPNRTFCYESGHSCANSWHHDKADFDCPAAGDDGEGEIPQRMDFSNSACFCAGAGCHCLFCIFPLIAIQENCMENVTYKRLPESKGVQGSPEEGMPACPPCTQHRRICEQGRNFLFSEDTAYRLAERWNSERSIAGHPWVVIKPLRDTRQISIRRNSG